LAVQVETRPIERDAPVVVHPGATASARTWSADGFAAAVRALREVGHDVVVTGAASEADLVDHVAGQRSGVRRYIGRPLAELASELGRARAVVCGNTGPAHLAAAVGTPIVSIFPPTVDPDAWRPWGVPHRLLGDLWIGCRGCRARVCPLPGHPCLAAVTPAAVVDAVAQLVEERSTSGGAAGVAAGDLAAVR
jgi:ADP-heptose:LPS heptosyltransferase